MRFDGIHLRRLRLVVLLGAMLVLASCTNLAGEPEIVATFPVEPTVTPQPPELGYPPQPPDLLNGAQIYAANCTRCHGVDGDGQGELVLSGEIPAMTSFLNAEAVRGQTPDDYYDIITNGNLANLMPPWAQSLTEQQRWDVAYYVYTLHYTPDVLANGADVWQRECAECHGERGAGDGPEMVGTGRDIPDLSDTPLPAVVSDQAWYYIIAEGVGDEMPAYQETLSEDELWASVAYSRLLGLSEFDASRDASSLAQPAIDTSSAETDVEVVLPDVITVQGSVTHGTTGADVPEGLTITVRYGNPDVGITDLQATVGEDGTYTIADVPVDAANEYVAFTVYNNMAFISPVVMGAELAADPALPITLYEVTEDPFAIGIEQMHFTIEPLEVGDAIVADDGTTQAMPPGGRGLIVRQRVTYHNQSDRVFMVRRNEVSASLLLRLPPGAIILNDQTRYIVLQQEYMLLDTAPVYPGEHLIEALYFLPYDGGAVIDVPVDNAYEGELRIVIAPQTLTVTSDAISESMLVGATGNMPAATIYTGMVDLARGETLLFNVEGSLFGTPITSDDPNLVTVDSLLPIVVVFVLILVAVMGAYLLWQRTATGNQQIDRKTERIVRHIAELDDMYRRGQIDTDNYQRERATLKAQLAQLMVMKDGKQATAQSTQDKKDKIEADDDPKIDDDDNPDTA